MATPQAQEPSGVAPDASLSKVAVADREQRTLRENREIYARVGRHLLGVKVAAFITSAVAGGIQRCRICLGETSDARM